MKPVWKSEEEGKVAWCILGERRSGFGCVRFRIAT